MAIDLTKCWTEQPLVVVDFETCGLDASNGAVEVAAVRFEGGVVVDSFSTLLDPGHPIPPDATAIHGITDAMVANAPTLLSVAASLLRVCRDAIPCAYSSDFDRSFLHAQITGNECPAFDPEQRWMDPLVIVKDVDKYVKGKGRHRLTATCARWKVTLDEAHRARADAEAAGRLLYALLEKGKVRRCRPLPFTYLSISLTITSGSIHRCSGSNAGHSFPVI